MDSAQPLWIWCHHCVSHASDAKDGLKSDLSCQSVRTGQGFCPATRNSISKILFSSRLLVAVIVIHTHTHSHTISRRFSIPILYYHWVSHPHQLQGKELVLLLLRCLEPKRKRHWDVMTKSHHTTGTAPVITNFIISHLRCLNNLCRSPLTGWTTDKNVHSEHKSDLRKNRVPLS